ncbi:MAG: hypothetical protein LCH63_15400 [Candidatus Melainabacteria bacterium]|nr:hypothetical protein [Candidatus Melainabacteria bacterium]
MKKSRADREFRAVKQFMSKRIIPFLLSLVLCQSAQAEPQRNTNSKPTSGDECIVIKQRDFKVGDMTVYLSPERARVDAMSGRCTICASAPDWRVTVFNKSGQYYMVERSAWKAKGLHGLTRSKRESFDFKDGKPVKIKYLNLQCFQVSRSSRGTEPSTVDVAFRSEKSKVSRDAKPISCVTTYIATSDLPLSQGAADFVEGLYLTVPQARVFLLSETKGPGFLRKGFVTENITKAKLPPSFFAVPTGLRKAYSLAAVATGSDMEDILLDVTGGRHP